MPVQNTDYKYKQPVFKEYIRGVFEGKFFYKNDTWFYRNGAFWPKLVSFLIDKFKDVPKVNVYCYGCSDGSEPFTFLIQLLSDFDGKYAEKFLPLVAKDRDKNVINKVKNKEYYHVKNDEKDRINIFTKGNYRNFFSEIDKTLVGAFAFIKNDLYEKIKFSQADIWKDYKNIKPDNSVVFVRNFWPYLKSEQKRQALLNKLSSRLDKNSFIIIGDFDERGTDFRIENQIMEAGFKPTPLGYVYEKIV